MAKKEIQDINDIQQLVNTFYTAVRNDVELGPIFEEVIQDRWSEHLEKMYRFWQTILLGEHTYTGRPFPPHLKLSIGKVHFERWVTLFTENIDSQFNGSKAEEAKSRAKLMAQLFNSKIEYFRAQSI